ncbi:polymorphic toxin-type HINT domain-containing protein [Streptomyces sp. NPDC051320]|uniref:polymorphic toxin-type HINT domain-containing protein n=1 Tax=Streptomyces sp. NPDC051320 TaxID=3154644 RepID=UPI00341206AE
MAPLAHAAPDGLGRPDVPTQRVSKVRAVTGLGAKKARARVAKDKKANAALAKKATAERKTSWPKPGQASLDLTATKAVSTKAGGLSVTLAAPKTKSKAKPPVDASGSALVRVLDQKAAQKAGITGVLLTASAEKSGQAQVSIDYGPFAGSLGGGWGGRLHLVELPDCVLTTPQKKACRTQTPVTSHNDVGAHTVTGTVALVQGSSGLSTQTVGGATVLALTAATSGGSGTGENPAGTGNYSATKLAASSAWQAGGSSGAFTWSYGFTLPPAAAGPTPSLSLSYDSGGIDGETATTNNQGTAVGEGFGLAESYITRQYGSCDGDGHADVNDECWKYDNARLVLNGKSTRLVKDNDSGQWRLEGDDASKVTRSTGADNGDDDGEYWTVTTGDGTQYTFGLNKLDGAGTQRTNSVWTVPVFGDDSGEPGYAKGDAFADRALTQGWRWNLDYVVDPVGNAATYWYAKESNYYKKNKAATANASYTRGGYLTEIKYGLRKGALFTDDADAKVSFSYAERCTASDCSSLTKDTADNWPDVPFDSICSKDDTDCDASGPTFFSRKRLTDIDTYSWAADTKTYTPVDSWKLTEQYLDGGDIGDSSDQVLTLKSLTHTGKAGDTAVTLKPVSFTYQMRPNRVDATDDILPLTRPRISTITSETGGITSVTLSAPECKRSEVLDAPQDTNTRSCYPQYWHINGAKDAAVDWFNKYRVEDVLTSDPTGNNEAVENAYSYAGAAWHYNDDPFTPNDERTWSDWRGYAQVTSYTGALKTTRSKTVSLYLQGMDGDKKKDGTTRAVSVAPLSSPSLGISGYKDSDQLAGKLREQVTYDGTTAIAATMNDVWSKETARQSPPDAGDHVARYVRNQHAYSYTYLSASKTWRSSMVSTAYDSYGMPDLVADYGQIGKGGDQTCTRTWYARNTAAGITALVSRKRTVAADSCSVKDTSLSMPAASATRGDLISDTATVYDDADATSWSATQKPTQGQVTWTGRATGYAATAGSDGLRAPTGWQTTATTTYDTLGRPQSITDAEGHANSTAYTPADAGPLTKTIITDPKGYRSVTFLDPRRELPLRSYDINLKKTEQAYDALGRLTDVWLPNRVRGAGYAPNSTFAYHIDNTKPSWVSTGSLKKDGDTYNTTYALFDALLRPLQTQSPTPQGGRLLTDTRYDSRGLAYETYADVFDNTSTPNGTYTRAEYGQTPDQTETVFDGAGRPTTSTLVTYGVNKWSTTTSYTGDSTATTALQGGSATRAITDIRGQTTETREYSGASPTDTDFGGTLGTSYTSTKSAYGLDGQQLSVTGPDGAKWSYGYDLFGRNISADDPDKGKSTTAYNTLDQVVKSTDSRGKSILSAYDEMGRATGTWDGAKDDAHQLTGYTYDSILKGQPASSTRYVGGKTGQAYTTTVTAYDSLSRPSANQLTLPSTDPFVKAGEPSTLNYDRYYNIDGSLQQNKEPALGGLSSEIVDYTYDELGDLTRVGGLTGYLRDVDYSALAQPQLLTLGTGGTGNKNIYVADTYEEGTGRLTRSSVTDQTHPYMLQDLNYSHDQTGNVTAISDPITLGGTSSAETQCFTYDGHQRLTQAWTPTTQRCDTAPSASTLSGPAPYWNSYTYNPSGQRQSETVHEAAGETKTTYCYTGAQPHTLTGTTTKTDCTKPEKAYSYDKTGNTTNRPGTTGTQALVWSDEGDLAKVTEDGKATDYLYGADGNLLIRTTHDGERVLYAGATELHLKADGTTWAQRYYSAGTTAIAMRTNQSGKELLRYLAGDNHNTSSLAITSDDTQAITKRHMDPFGAERGKPVGQAWPDDKGFLGKTNDSTTGLTHIGAREYDPTTGQFISVDPLLQTGMQQTLNGYAYSHNNPVTDADPSGLGNADCMTGVVTGCTGGLPDHDSVYHPNRENRPCAWNCNIDTPRQEGGTSNSYERDGIDRNSDGRISIAPAVDVSADWKYAQRFTKEFMEQGLQLCYVGDLSCFDPSDDIGANSLAVLKFNVCVGMGARTDCFHEVGASLGGAMGANMMIAAQVEYGPRGNRPGVSGKGGAGPCSFSPDTPVLMEKGKTKPIGKIKKGDKVEAADPETGKHKGPRPVTARWINHDDDLVDLTIRKQDGSKAVLHTTSKHPFWDDTTHTWVPAGHLARGHALNTSSNTHVFVTAITVRAGAANMYNLTVRQLHTYYVLSGATPVLVHNCNGDLPEGYTSSPALEGDPYHPDSVAARSQQNRELYAGTVGDRAGALGYRTRIPAQKAPFNSHGQVVFSNGKNYITPDVDGHNVSDGWKMFNRKGQRIGTYDPDLNYLKE